MERSYQAAVLSDDSPLRKTGIRDVVLRDDERLSVAVMQPLLLVNSSCVAPPRKHQQLQQMRLLRSDLILLKDSRREFFSDLFGPDNGFSSALSITRLTVALQYRFVIS